MTEPWPGRKPPMPKTRPGQHGRKPSAPQPHKSSGKSSSSASPAVIALAFSMFIVAPLLFVGTFIAYVISS